MRIESVSADHISALLVADEHVYAATWGDGVLRSDDGGESWEERNVGLGSPMVYTLVRRDERLLAGSTEGVYVSSDQARSWRRMRGGIRNRHVFSLAGVGGALLAGTWRRGVLRSAGKEGEWQSVGGEMAFRVVYCYETRADTIWAGTSGHGVFRSTDTGRTWTSAGLPGTSVPTLRHAGGRLYAGTWARGVYARSGRDTVWEAVGLTGTSVRSVSTAGTDLFVVQQDAHVFRRGLTDSEWKPLVRIPCEGTSLVRHAGSVLIGTWGCGIYTLAATGKSWAAAQGATGERSPTAEQNSPRHDLANPRGAGADLALCDTSANHSLECSGGAPATAGIAVCNRGPAKALTIRYSVPRRVRARVCVFDFRGSKIASLVHGHRTPGIYSICLDSHRYQSGVYVIELCTDLVTCTVRAALGVDEG